MTQTTDLLTLAQWMSPSFPVGAFSYSHGLETVVTNGTVQDADDLLNWLTGVLRHGGGWSDAVLLVAAYQADDPAEIDALTRALAPSAERLLETELQGAAFSGTVSQVSEATLPDLSYPVAVGAAARAAGLPATQSAAIYLHGFAANLVSAAIRLVPLGQTEGQQVLSRLAPLCAELAEAAVESRLEDLGTCSWAADIASMTHETQTVRLFRS